MCTNEFAGRANEFSYVETDKHISTNKYLSWTLVRILATGWILFSEKIKTQFMDAFVKFPVSSNEFV